MSDDEPILDSLRCDPEYRWNDDVTDELTREELWARFIRDAEELDIHNEFEVSYGIYRKLVWRFPDRALAWQRLAEYAAKMGLSKEASVARRESERLKSG